MSLLFQTNEEKRPCFRNSKVGLFVWETMLKRIYADRHRSFRATTYFAIFFAAATDSTITISPMTLPFAVALSPASLSSSASCPSSV